ncbi:MAG TPA: hypothetical protein VER32_03775 [Pyrinomonadaceae bacterium]|nr:hypothetical protein [Pyrinomonadaceae bacterium]
MADEQKREGQDAGGASSGGNDSKGATGDPGRTPGKAEGDEETIDEALEKQG